MTVPCRGEVVACRARAWEFTHSVENKPVWIWKLIWKGYPLMQAFCRLGKALEQHSERTFIVKEHKKTPPHVNGFVDLMICHYVQIQSEHWSWQPQCSPIEYSTENIFKASFIPDWFCWSTTCPYKNQTTKQPNPESACANKISRALQAKPMTI